MKRRILLLYSCVVLSVLLTGCQFVSDNMGKEERQSETAAEAVTESKPVAVNVKAETEKVKQDSEAAVVSYEEEYMQCPYCAHWFSTGNDGNGIPYDRHLEEERETDSAHGLTEAELVECSDCGNWYPAGNIFRNHICEGRQW